MCTRSARIKIVAPAHIVAVISHRAQNAIHDFGAVEFVFALSRLLRGHASLRQVNVALDWVERKAQAESQ